MLWIVLVCLLFYTYGANGLQCMDENNKPVDWFVAYKLPKIHHDNTLIQNGLAYTFMTSDDYRNWTLSKNSINSTNTIFYNTISKLYAKNSEDIFYVTYNDQPPNGESNDSKGHNKGVVAADSEGGFWLVHSVPHFPPINTSYRFPHTGVVYGQSFLCISMNLENLNKVGLQLQFNEPQVYGKRVPKSDLKVPELYKAAAGITVKSAPWYQKAFIQSKRGANFTSFAKSKYFGKDLYEDWLAPALQSDLFVETWPKGPGKLLSNCTKQFKVYNIQNVNIAAGNLSFTTTHDHSKWAVSTPTSSTSNWICIGDINRMEHQFVRGGGTVCLNNKQLAQTYRKLVTSVEECPRNTTTV